MPNCPPKSDADRRRWENIVGKALKTWATALMQFGMTRDEARDIILAEIGTMTERVNADFEEKKKGGMFNEGRNQLSSQ